MPPNPSLRKKQFIAAAPDNTNRELERLATLDYLDAIRPEADHILQQLVDEVRSIFGTDLCMVNLNLSDVQYFRAWSGDLPARLAEARQDALKHSMCQYVVNTEKPLIVKDFLTTEEFREQHWCVNFGIHFYAGTPLITSDGVTIGTLCVLNAQPVEFDQEQMRVLGGFAQAVVGRFELLAALRREQAARVRETQRSEELQRTLDSLSAHVAIIDEAGTIIAVNKSWRAFAQANGVAGQNYAEGANYLEVCESAAGAYSREAAPFADGIRSVLSGQRKTFELEYPCHSPSERRWFIGRVTPFAGGGPPRAVVTHENISERKRAEEQIRFQARLLDAVGQAIIATDPQGKIIYWNRAAEELYGWLAEEVTGRSIVEVTPSEELIERAEEIMSELSVGRSWSGEFEVRRKDGSTLTAMVTDTPVHDQQGTLEGIIGVSTDITGLKKTEEALRENEATLNAILNSLTEGVLVADTWGHVVFANSSARAMLGVTGDDPLDKLPDPWEDFSLPEAIAHCTRSRGSIEAGVRFGETFLRVKLECLLEFEESRGEALVVIQDLSAGRQLEANQQRFLANAAHQLRTPIMAILGAAELLATGEDADPAIKHRLLNHLLSEGRRMQRLSETLLRLSQIGWDRRDPDLEIVDLREAGQDAAERMEPLAESAGLRIVVEDVGGRVRADSEWLQEVLLVLLSNALKHSSRGGDVKIRLGSRAIAVEDEGIGISPTDLPHIFERFYRGEGGSEGFGLGLSICKELVERMGGSISIDSQEGVGTSVKVELPEASVDAQHTDR